MILIKVDHPFGSCTCFSTSYWHSLKDHFVKELSLSEYIPSEQTYHQLHNIYQGKYLQILKENRIILVILFQSACKIYSLCCLALLPMVTYIPFSRAVYKYVYKGDTVLSLFVWPHAKAPTVVQRKVTHDEKINAQYWEINCQFLHVCVIHQCLTALPKSWMSYIFCVFTCKNKITKFKLLFIMVWGLRMQRQRPHKTHQAKSGRQQQFCTSFAHFAFGSRTTVTRIAAQRLRAELGLPPAIKVGSFFHKDSMTQDTFYLTADSAHRFRGSCSNNGRTRSL